MKTLLKVLLGIVAFGAIVVGLVFWLTSGIVKQGDLFLAYLANHDFEAAYAMTSEEFHEVSTQEDIETLFTGAYDLSGLESTTWNSREVENNQGRLLGSVTLEGGTTYSAELQFSKEDGTWKILYIELN